MLCRCPVSIDWPEYLRNHADRRNLLIHLIAVPLFVGATLYLILHLYGGNWPGVTAAAVAASISLVVQGRGHALEKKAPRPFTGPGNFLRRWFTEQFITFPLFVLSGRWWQQYRACREMR